MSGLTSILGSAAGSAAGSAGSTTGSIIGSGLSSAISGALQQGKNGNPAAGGMPQAPALGMGQPQPPGHVMNAFGGGQQQPTSLMEYYQLLDKLRR